MHRSLAARMPCGRVRHVRKRARAGDWPPNIDAATRFSIVYAFKKAKGPSVNDSSAPAAAPAPAPANASSPRPHATSAKEFGAGASNAQSVSRSAAAPSASKLAPLLVDGYGRCEEVEGLPCEHMGNAVRVRREMHSRKRAGTGGAGRWLRERRHCVIRMQRALRPAGHSGRSGGVVEGARVGCNLLHVAGE